MAVKLRLMRMGKKKQPTYRVVAADSRKARNGRFIEVVGFYDPRQDPSVIEIETERAVHWLQHGAQPSERVKKLLQISGAWESFSGEAFVPPEPKAKKKEEVVEEAAEEVVEEVVEEAAEEVVEEAAEEVVEEAAEEVVEEAAEEVVEEAAEEVVEEVVEEEEENQ
ncbi:MAG: 30S ribosomal protein S16 [Acidimicrobiales bacterium]|nr:30S ribosomal protein S16 [Acidimicrobiales bacterium]